MLLMIAFGGNWNFVPQIPFVGRGLFLTSVAVVWYLVGRAVEQRGKAPDRKHSVAFDLSTRTLSFVAGVLLLLIVWRGLSYPETTLSGAYLDVVQNIRATPALGLIGTSLTLAWALGLIFFSGRSLVRMFRCGLPRSE